ncbi:hypothetical protein RF644_07420 [Kocuria sp. CPCC 205258]|uniref:hypothetical protein n=1 Tax=Kocuria sp. CPCC 205258 TaxID=3073552 RepID=UPI0034D6DADF
MPKLLRWFMGIFAIFLIARYLPLAIQTGDVLAWVTTTGAVLMLVSLVVMALESRKRDKTHSEGEENVTNDHWKCANGLSSHAELPRPQGTPRAHLNVYATTRVAIEGRAKLATGPR